MRGGSNKKSIQEHLDNGTYRPSLHGYVLSSDEEALKQIKQELYSSILLITKDMGKLDRFSDTYKNLNTIRSDQIKTFHSICKVPIEEKPKLENNPDGFKT
jgi:beta-lactamase superfamily II metal-dependent hydrolase